MFKENKSMSHRIATFIFGGLALLASSAQAQVSLDGEAGGQALFSDSKIFRVSCPVDHGVDRGRALYEHPVAIEKDSKIGTLFADSKILAPVAPGDFDSLEAQIPIGVFRSDSKIGV